VSAIDATLGSSGRERAAIAAAAAGAIVFGAMISSRPVLAVGLAGLGAILALAFLAPVTHLTLLLFVTAIVPYDLQNAFGGRAGLILSDALLLSGLVRAALVLVRSPLERRTLGICAATLALAGLAGLQAVRGYLDGAGLSQAGYEFRALLGWSALIVAVPILLDPRARRKLYTGLLVVGIGLGLWGLAQYFLRIPLIGGGSSGIREGVNFTSGAISIQGGLFGFPIATIMGLAVLGSETRLSTRTRLALIVLVATNAIALLFTYERTYWIAAMVGFAFITLKGGLNQKVKAAVWLVASVLVLVPALSVIAPRALPDAQQRLLSLTQYGSDDSVRSRIVETRAVMAKIHERPLTGWGLGDEVWYGMPWLRVPPSSTDYTHNGYLWVAWKLGVPGALLLLAIIGWAVLSRAPPDLDPLETRIRDGAQAGLVISLTVALLFPSFRALAITATLGVLVAICLIGPRRPPASYPSRPTRLSER
jgi:hypothetical protein